MKKSKSTAEQHIVMVVIPAFNEASHIAGVIQSIPASLRAHGKMFNTRVVVVEDGSTDNTAEQARGAGAIVLSHVVNTGAGGATRTGLRYAEQLSDVAYVVTIDGDGQHASNDIQHLIEYAVKHDSQFVVGNRLHASNKAVMPLIRRIANWAASLISRVLFGIKTKDTQSGMRLYRWDVLPKISGFTLDRYGFCTETLWYALKSGIRIDEVPIAVSYHKEALAKGQSAWASLEILRDLIKVRISG